MSASEGLYALFNVSDLAITLLTGVSLSGEHTKSPFYQMGSISPMKYMQGHVEWTLGWTRALTDSANLGSFNVGTHLFLGTVFPLGGARPAIAGTIVLNSVAINNMEACNESAVEEDFTAKFYNLSFMNTSSTTTTSTSTSTSTT